MQITLKCAHESGSAAFSAEMIEAVQAPERRYEIVNGMVILDGYPDVVLHHDADELLRNPLYRMLTPGEQDALAAKEQADSSVAESVPVVSVAETKKQKVNNEG